MPWEVAKEVRELVEEFAYHVTGLGYRNVYGDEKDY
jgi:hypothetical protein